MKTQRRSLLKRLFGSLAGAVGLGATTSALAARPSRDDAGREQPGEIPLYSGSKQLGNLVFVSGAGAHFAGDVKAHTNHVLNELEKELIKAGSSMQKVLKANVLLNDLDDYNAMNEVYRGRFGAKPPVRTTVAVRAGVPGDSLVEIDCIAYI